MGKRGKQEGAAPPGSAEKRNKMDDHDDDDEDKKEKEEEGAPNVSGGSDDDDDSDASSGSSGSSDGSDGSGSETDDGSSAPDVSDSDGPESSDDDDGGKFEAVDVRFEFYDPKESDFHGLKALLTPYLDGAQYDCSGLADAVIAQSTVGTVVKTGEDDDPIAVMTALNTRRYADRPFMREARDFLLKRASTAAAAAAAEGGGSGGSSLREQFEKAWDAEGTALLLNERLVNAPPALAPPLVQALLDEVAWATEDEPTPELRASFKVERYVLITRAYTDPLEEGEEAEEEDGEEGRGGASGSGSGDKGKQKQKEKKKKAKGGAKKKGDRPLVVYVRPEDEFLHAQASCSFTWPVEGRAVAKDELRPMRLAMVVTAAGAAAARKELDRVVGNAAAMAPPPPVLLGGGGAKGKKGK